MYHLTLMRIGFILLKETERATVMLQMFQGRPTGQPGKEVKIMATRMGKIAITFAIIVATVLVGMTFVMSDDAYAGTSSSVVIVRPGFDDRFVAPRPFFRPFFNPFLFDDDFFFEEEEEEFFFERRPFFFDREDFFEREERDD